MANTPLGFPFGFYVADNSPIDGKYGVLQSGTWRPYATMQEALTAVPQGIRHIGLTINIGGTEYWWAQGVTDSELVVKNNGGGGGGGVTAWKSSVRVATTANITLSGTQTIDGIAVAAGDRVLVKNQTTQSQNGIYVVASGSWARADDADAANELQNAVVSVDQGTINADTSWRQITDSIVVGTSAVVWTSFGSAAVTASNGLTKTLDNVKLGGTLTENTTIDAGTRTLTILRGDSSVVMNQNIFLTAERSIFLVSTTNIAIDAGEASVNLFGRSVNIADVSGGSSRFSTAYATSAVSTNNDTPATLHTQEVIADKNVTIRATITARRTGGTAGTNGDIASFELAAAFKNPGLTGAAQVGATSYVFAFKSQASWNVIFDTNGNDARIRVIGALNNNIDWLLNKIEIFKDS